MTGSARRVPVGVSAQCRQDDRVKREYIVTIADAEAARLRAFDNKAEGKKLWPLGPNRTFWRKNEATFVVKEYAGSAVGGAMVLTLGEATLLAGSSQVLVTVKTKGHALGYLLIACGVLAGCATPRGGILALLLGAALALAGWFFFAKRRGVADDLDDVEKVLRAEIHGHWQPLGG